MMSGELEQEARHSSTPQKDFEKGLDSGVVSGSADLSSMEVSNSLELSSVEVEKGRDSGKPCNLDNATLCVVWCYSALSTTLPSCVRVTTQWVCYS